MTSLALGLSLFIAVMGALGVVSPARLFWVLRHYQTPGGLYVAAAIRVVLGVALFLAAPMSKAPDFIRVFGVIAVAAGLFTPIVGLSWIGKVIEWWSSQPTIVLRVWAGFALALGLFLAWAVIP